MNIGAWWESLSSVQQIFAAAAIPATIILILQTLLTLLGLGHGSDAEAGEADAGDMDAGDFDADGDGGCDVGHTFGEDSTSAEDGGDVDGLRLLTVRGIIAFFAIGGWFGVFLVDIGVPEAFSILGAVAVGCLAALLIALFFKGIARLQTNGNLNISNAVGKNATVYLTIPAAGSSTGKITLELQDRYVELEAKTKQPEPILTGSTVRIVDVLENNTLLVEVLTES